MDEKKNKSNLEKHGFELFEGAIVFEDEKRIEFPDIRFDYKENRMITIGKYFDEIILSVCWTVRKNKIRLISVRSASKKERRLYYGYSQNDT